MANFQKLQLSLILRVSGQICQILQISAAIHRILPIPPGSLNSHPKSPSKKPAKPFSQKISQPTPPPKKTLGPHYASPADSIARLSSTIYRLPFPSQPFSYLLHVSLEITLEHRLKTAQLIQQNIPYVSLHIDIERNNFKVTNKQYVQMMGLGNYFMIYKTLQENEWDKLKYIWLRPLRNIKDYLQKSDRMSRDCKVFWEQALASFLERNFCLQFTETGGIWRIR